MKGKEDRGIQFGTCAGANPIFALEMFEVDVSAVHKCPAAGGADSWPNLKSDPSTAQRRCSTRRKYPASVLKVLLSPVFVANSDPGKSHAKVGGHCYSWKELEAGSIS